MCTMIGSARAWQPNEASPRRCFPCNASGLQARCLKPTGQWLQSPTRLSGKVLDGSASAGERTGRGRGTGKGEGRLIEKGPWWVEEQGHGASLEAKWTPIERRKGGLSAQSTPQRRCSHHNYAVPLQCSKRTVQPYRWRTFVNMWQGGLGPATMALHPWSHQSHRTPVVSHRLSRAMQGRGQLARQPRALPPMPRKPNQPLQVPAPSYCSSLVE